MSRTTWIFAGVSSTRRTSFLSVKPFIFSPQTAFPGRPRRSDFARYELDVEVLTKAQGDSNHCKGLRMRPSSPLIQCTLSRAVPLGTKWGRELRSANRFGQR